MSGLVHVSLFSGVGGVDLAMHQAGIPTIAACEIDKAARGVLADRFPDVHLYTDVKEVTGDGLRELGVDRRRTVLSAGFPCQDLSVAGARRGMVRDSGTRSALFWEVDRLLGELRPAWVVLENVPGLLSSRRGRDMGAVLGSLADRGYGFAYRVLDAQHFGVPQRRRRVVVVGRLGDDGTSPAQVLLEPEGVPGHPLPGVSSGPHVAAGVGRGATACGVLGDIAHTLTGQGHDAGEDGTGRGTPIVATPLAMRGREGGAQLEVMDEDGPSPTLRAGDGGSSRSPLVMIEPAVAFHMTQGGAESPALGAKSGGMGVAYVADRTTALDTAQGGPDDNAAQGGHLVAFQKVIRSGARDADGNLPPEVWAERDIAATLNLNDLGSESRAVEVGDHLDSDVTVRRLTPTECERLQGFPDGHTATSWGKTQADSPRYKQMGNAVAVPVFTWVARRIAAQDARQAVAA